MAHQVARAAAAADPAASRPPASPEAGGAATRERILDVALDLFVRKGYTETSLREIAAPLLISKAALYYHFESKQAILLALHRRLHDLMDGLQPLLQAGAEEDDNWERLCEALIGLALQNRRLIELHLRNQEAMADLHRAGALEKHGPASVLHLETHLLDLLRDPAVPLERRLRRVASVGAIAGVVLATNAFAGVPDADLESALRGVVHNVLTGPAP